MNFQKIIPIKPLQPYVRYFWILEQEKTGNDQISLFKTIPDGLPSLIFQETGLFVEENKITIPQLYVYGQHSTYSNQYVRGAFKTIGVYLEPTALKALFKYSAHEFKNKNIPLDQLVSHSILDQLLNTKDSLGKINILSQFLLNQLGGENRVNSIAKEASQLLQRGYGLQEIQQALNISERSLERLVKQNIGVSPLLFSRIMRLQNSLNVLREASFSSLTSVAYQHHYFDQSHFIKDFKLFTGTTPKVYLNNSTEQLINFPRWIK